MKTEELVRSPEKFALFEWVDVDKIVFPDYTRKTQLSANKVKELSANFDIKKVGVLMLSYRDKTDEYACMSGLHRTEAARLSGIKKLPAWVFLDLDYQTEADLWLAWGKDNPTTAAQRFNARLEAREPAALNIRAVLRKNNFDVNVTSKGDVPNTTRAVAELDMVYRVYGLQALDDLMELLQEAYGNEAPAYHSLSIGGHAAFLARYAHRANRTRLVSQLHKVGINKLVQMNYALKAAGEGLKPGTSFARAIFNAYNHGLRSGKLVWVERVVTEKQREASTESTRRHYQTDKLENWLLNALRTSGRSMTIVELSKLNGAKEKRIGYALKRLAALKPPLVSVVGKLHKQGRLWVYGSK